MGRQGRPSVCVLREGCLGLFARLPLRECVLSSLSHLIQVQRLALALSHQRHLRGYHLQVVVEGLQSLSGAELAPLRAACGVRFGTRLVSALWRSERAAPKERASRPSTPLRAPPRGRGAVCGG